MTDQLTVMVVDDSDDLRDMLCMLIRRQSASWTVVATATQGEEAVSRATDLQPDLVLLDIAMPVMDGMQALPLIRHACPSAVVVMLSGYPFATAGQGALDAGAHGYLEKADLVKTLIPRIESILATARARGGIGAT